MTAPLPPELLQIIFDFALFGASPGERQSTRHAFGAVCRGWRRSVDRWKAFEVLDHVQLGRLITKMTEDPDRAIGRRVRALQLSFVGHRRAPQARQIQRDLSTLLGLTPHVEELGITLLKSSVDELAPDEGDGVGVDWLGPRFGLALARLTRITHFSLTGVDTRFGPAFLSCSWLHRYLTSPVVPKWMMRD